MAENDDKSDASGFLGRAMSAMGDIDLDDLPLPLWLIVYPILNFVVPFPLWIICRLLRL